MPEKPKKLSVKILKILFEATLILGLLIVIAGGLMVWRLNHSPVDLEFAKSSILEALRDEEQGISVTADKIVLHWPELRGPLLLGLQWGKVYGPDQQTILSVEEAALGVNKAKLLIGQIAPEALVLKAPSLSIIRYEGNRFDIGINLAGNAVSEESESVIENILSALGDEDDEDGAPLSKLQSFEIQRARVVINDLILGMTWEAITADARFVPVRDGMQAELHVEFPQNDTPSIPVLTATVLLDKQTENLGAYGRVENIGTKLLSDKVPELKILEAYDGFLSSQFSFLLNKDMQLLSADLKEAQFSVGDVLIEANASVKDEEKNINGSARIEIKNLPHAAIRPLWPKELEKENAKEWVVDKLSDGVFSNVYAQSDIVIPKDETGWNFEAENVLQNLIAGFDFEGMTIEHKSTMKPVKNAKGQGSFSLDEEKLRIDIEEATLLDMEIPKAELEFYNIIEAGAGTADINIDLNGPLKSVLEYVADEPLNVKPNFDVENTQGQTALKINLGFPTKDNVLLEDFDIDIQGTVTDANVPKLLKDLPLSGGPFTLKIDNEKLKVSGNGELAKRPVTVEYEEFLKSKGKPYSSRVKASLNIDPNLRTQFGMDLSEFLDGTARADIVYTSFGDGKSEAEVDIDLTQSRLYFDPFDYEKPSGQKASAKLKAIMQNGQLKTIQNLVGSAPSFKLENSQLGFREAAGETALANGKISRFSLNETVAGLDFEIEPSGKIKLVLNGPFLDLRPFLDNEGEPQTYDNPPIQLSVAVDRMRTADEQTVQYGKLYADINKAGKFNQLEMDGIAGAGDIYLRYKPDATGKRVFRFEADDAGAALRAFDLYENIIGGKLVIYGEPIRGVFDRNLLGRAEITNFKVVDAPSLARLLGAMSLPGLDQTLSGEGLGFTKLESNFDWLYRPEGSLLVLKDGRTSGNSLGLTFDGTFDNASNTVDVKGTIIPLSGVNKIIGNIPIVGDILTGGTGALIAATYTMKGQGNDPKIVVNPLSALTPGILRRILFED